MPSHSMLELSALMHPFSLFLDPRGICVREWYDPVHTCALVRAHNHVEDTNSHMCDVSGTSVD